MKESGRKCKIAGRFSKREDENAILHTSGYHPKVAAAERYARIGSLIYDN